MFFKSCDVSFVKQVSLAGASITNENEIYNQSTDGSEIRYFLQPNIQLQLILASLLLAEKRQACDDLGIGVCVLYVKPR